MFNLWLGNVILNPTGKYPSVKSHHDPSWHLSWISFPFPVSFSSDGDIFSFIVKTVSSWRRKLYEFWMHGCIKSEQNQFKLNITLNPTLTGTKKVFPELTNPQLDCREIIAWFQLTNQHNESKRRLFELWLADHVVNEELYLWWLLHPLFQPSNWWSLPFPAVQIIDQPISLTSWAQRTIWLGQLALAISLVRLTPLCSWWWDSCSLLGWKKFHYCYPSP